MKILLVDDSKTVCAVYSDLLTEAGYTVLVANSMEQAMQLAEEHRPPLAIVDYFMPGGNGDELTRALHENPVTASTVVAIHSQHHDVVKEALSAGAVELIGKEDPKDLFLMRVAALRTMVEAQTYQRNIEQLVTEKLSEDQPLKILLVDDSPTIRAVYGAYLRKGGFDVYEAGTIREGAAVAHQELPDMMLIDYMLPDGHGDQLVRTLLSQADTSNILMVIFSNKENLEDAALSAGAIDIISKDDPDEIFMRRIQSMRRYVLTQRKQRRLMREGGEEVERLLLEAETARREADKANQTKDDFLASMSHELRTPLTSIIGNCELLIQKGQCGSSCCPQHDANSIIRSIHAAGSNQLSLVNDILDMSKIASGKFTIENAPFDLQQLLDEIDLMLQIKARDQGIHLIFKVDSPLPYQLWGDSARIRQILINLLGNAIKFTEQGEVSLHCKVEGDHLQITVEDSGIGMPPEVVERLFQPFEQADSNTSKRFGGTGLGLYISQQLATLMEGEISVTSEEGVGSCFLLTLPYHPSEVPVGQKDPSAKQSVAVSEIPSNLRGTVLVAEDTPELQLLVRRMLESIGVEIEVAENGRVAVEKATRQPFDLILMDMQMPEMNGIEATEMLRGMGVETPVIALSANVMQKHRDFFMQAGADGFLAKPINRSKLHGVLAEYLQPAEQSSEDPAIVSSTVNDEQRILAVDDEESMLKTYELCFTRKRTIDEKMSEFNAMLASDGAKEDEPEEFSITTSNQGLHAVKLARMALEEGRPFKVALIDMRMPPGIDGLETAKLLRRVDERVFIVMVTAYTDIKPEQIQQELGHGVLYLNKPFNHSELQQITRLLMENWNRLYVEQQELTSSTQKQPPPVETSSFIDDELMALFQERCVELKRNLHLGIEKEDWVLLKSTAHIIKGSAGTFGFMDLSEKAKIVGLKLNEEEFSEAVKLGREMIEAMNEV